jgi:hypothetical protein
MFEWIIGILSFLLAGSLLLVILTLLSMLAGIMAYVLLSVGLYRTAEKRKLAYPWMAWVPIARYYLLGTLLRNELTITGRLRIPYFQFVLPVASGLLILWSGSVGWLLTVLVYGLIVMAYVALFRQYGDSHAATSGLLAGLPLLDIVGCFLVLRLGQLDAPDPSADATVFP